MTSFPKLLLDNRKSSLLIKSLYFLEKGYCHTVLSDVLLHSNRQLIYLLQVDLIRYCKRFRLPFCRHSVLCRQKWIVCNTVTIKIRMPILIKICICSYIVNIEVFISWIFDPQIPSDSAAIGGWWVAYHYAIFGNFLTIDFWRLPLTIR